MLAHQQNINDYMTKPIEKANSFLHFELKDRLRNKVIATNFLLLERFKYSTNIVDPNLKVYICIVFSTALESFLYTVMLFLFHSITVFNQRATMRSKHKYTIGQNHHSLHSTSYFRLHQNNESDDSSVSVNKKWFYSTKNGGDNINSILQYQLYDAIRH